MRPPPGEQAVLWEFIHTVYIQVTWKETHHVLTVASLGSDMWVTFLLLFSHFFYVIMHVT